MKGVVQPKAMTDTAPLSSQAVTTALIADTYRELKPLLRRLAIRRFRVPPDDAEGLVQEVFLAFVGRLTTIRDPRSWLIGTLCNECRDYWRGQGRLVPLPTDCETWMDPVSGDGVERLDARLRVQRILAAMDERCARLLRLRYLDGCTVPEVATALAMKYRYTKKRLYLCVDRFRAVYLATIGAPK